MNWKALALSGLAAVSALAPASQAQALEAVLVANGFSNPLYAVSPPGDTARLFVVEQNSGLIKIIKNGSTLGTPFLDVGALASSGGERGLLGLAFHPDYFQAGAAGERMFCINYTNNSGATVVRSYRASAGNPDVADAASFTTLITISQPFSNHNGGCVQFGPDKKLYIGMGDGGSANDPGNRSQNGTNLLGKMLRLDPTLPAPHIPADNPFIGNASVSNEIWSLGLRNPWRFTFDRATGDMWIADVGQNAREEINFEPAGAGGRNYGWRCMEGTNCTGLSGCTCNAAALTMPVDEYTHGGGNCSISGGFRYRGSLMPSQVGRYWYADLCTDNIWSIAFDGSTASDKVNHKTDLGLPGGVTIASFGEDGNGELYICDLSGGRIYRVQEECVGTAVNYCQGGTNSTGGSATLSANGSLNISDNTFSLNAFGCPSGIPGLFFYGPNQTQQPFGDGFRCVAGQVFRIPPVEVTDIFGIAIKNVDFTTLPESSGAGQILGGSTWNYQYWYRDPANGGAGFNLTNGLSVTFCP
jgi:glucose/arabinose dehydrogenase